MSAALHHGAVGEKAGTYTVAEFLRNNGLGKTKFYEEVKARRIRTVRCGGRTLILDEDAEAWRRALPAVKVRNPETKRTGA